MSPECPLLVRELVHFNLIPKLLSPKHNLFSKTPLPPQ